MTVEFISPERDPSLLEKILKMPCPQGEITLENEGSFVGFRNHLQFVLAMRKHGEENKEAAQSWILEHSADFRRAFDKVIDPAQGGDPHFFDGYASIGDIPQEKLSQLEFELYNTGHQQAA
jgi:hypothetical protein